ncbi:MAG: hypothetical protein NWE99_04460 [Candidatus Bathyarchaeota archaeon]|nr:hypothetical protein [Candidatus Bathyarchaeota archaeon]
MAKGEIEIYNEFSLQHEFGVYLRSVLDSTFKVQFERPVSFFGLARNDFVKKEVDVVVFALDLSEKYAFEFKYPRSGQYPEQMFKACQDIRFLEQLCRNSFTRCFFVMVADDPLFYEGGETGIYGYFRAGVPINGHIQKPTGAKDDAVDISGSYNVIWYAVDKRKYTVVEVD